MMGRQATVTRTLTTALAVLAVGCGPSGCKPTEGVNGPQTSGASEPMTSSAGGEVAEIDAPLLPILNEDALIARVEAQRALLGRRGVLFEDAAGRPVPWLSTAAPPTIPSEDDALLDSLPGSSGLGPGRPVSAPGSRVNGNALGLFVPIEGPATGDPPLSHFHEALRDLQQGRDADGKVRIAVYGASHTDADIYPHYIRRYLQSRFGDGGHGFVHIARPWRWYKHVDFKVDGGPRWKTEHAQRRGAREDGYFGLLGASLATSSKRAVARVAPRHGTVASQYEILYLEQPRGGSFRVVIDGERKAIVKTGAKAFGPGYHHFDVPEGTHTVEVKPVGDGEIRMFGMTAERDTSGVVVDTLGISGTRASNHLRWDESVWTDNFGHRRPDLYILAYGTNEAAHGTPLGIYESRLREVLGRFARAAPGASCLLVGPGDSPLLVDGQFIPRQRASEIAQIQARVADEMGCGFWDMLAFMGGELSMLQWANANPPMARADHIHLTKRGYVRMGMALVDAMMMDFDADDPLAAGSKPQP